MKKIDNNVLFYSFSKELKPALEVDSCETVVFRTKDCFTGQICKPTDFDALNWDSVNPATGPVYIKGAKRGDVLKVEILKIDVNSTGVVCVAPNGGVLGSKIKKAEAKVLNIKDDKVIFNDKVSFPINKMIGVIGVAPDGEPVANGTPGTHGGNMDNKRITEGATLYLPIFHDGALFGLGDLHAAMGDGEICVTGLEVGGEVTVKLTVIKDKPQKHPMLEDAQNIYTIASAISLDDATKIATGEMAEFLVDKTGLPFADVTMIMSLTGNIEIAQIVDPLMTVRFAMPKSVVKAYFNSIY